MPINRKAPFNLEVSRGRIEAHSFIHKFGQATDIQTADGFADIWDGVGDANANANYIFSNLNDIDTISSSNAGDNQDIEIQGLDTNYIMVTQTITLNGQTKVSLTTSLLRVFRMKNIGTTNIAGTVYCYVDGAITAGVPNTANSIRAIIENGNNQTLMAIYTIPAGMTGYLKKGFISLAKKTSAFASFRVRMRELAGVFQTKETGQISSTGNGAFQYEYPYPLPIPEKTDIIVEADVSTNDVGISAAFDILLITNL